MLMNDNLRTYLCKIIIIWDRSHPYNQKKIKLYHSVCVQVNVLEISM